MKFFKGFSFKFWGSVPPPGDLTGPEDYNKYQMTNGEKARYICLASAVLLAIGLIFYNNIIIAGLMACGGVLYPKYKAIDLGKKRQKELGLQFKDALYSLSSSLSAGKSLESAFAAALSDLRILYCDDNAYIIKEFRYICHKIQLNLNLEDSLLDFAHRSGLEDIRNFAEVVQICKRTGGNLVQVIKNTSGIISDKIEIAQEIELLLAKQKYEQKILNIMPVIFIALIKFGGSGYMDSLYSSPEGYLLMSLALGIIAASILVSKKIFEIRV